MAIMIDREMTHTRHLHAASVATACCCLIESNVFPSPGSVVDGLVQKEGRGRDAWVSAGESAGS